MPSTDRRIFLTFDDGPVPGVTDFVLNELEKRGQKATFFVVGDNVRKNLTLAEDILKANHTIGNHTFNHFNGWKTNTDRYLENVDRCQKILEDQLNFSPGYFRPPYGLLKSSQAKDLQKKFQIVMWSLLSGDFDLNLSKEIILKKSKSGTRPGTVVVFHDQEKTKEIIRRVLPEYLDFLGDQGWKTESL
ncbi:polysaccharide deacetylase family protein [Algoriphagus hitonicola]|nr:polysaccharide deacetylase family protein [Algoriphagus hitonicola]